MTPTTDTTRLDLSILRRTLKAARARPQTGAGQLDCALQAVKCSSEYSNVAAWSGPAEPIAGW
jgi:hypothetical protein